MTQTERIAANLAAVRERIGVAARTAGRSPDEVRLIGVTKYVPLETVRMLVAAGCRDVGESRPQQLWDRAAEFATLGVRRHFIGHLQRNKIRRTLPAVDLIHSGDSLRLLEELDREAAALGDASHIDVLLEVNVSGDAAKHGFAVEEVPPLVDRLAELKHPRIRGLMAMAGLNSDEAATRREFASLRTLQERLQAEWSGRFTLDELSMGMSGDFEAAVAEGATMIRIGSALFAGLEAAGEL